MSEHTKVPWKLNAVIQNNMDGSKLTREFPIYTASGKFAHPATAHNEPDAAFIVQACNNHYQLIEALKKIATPALGGKQQQWIAQEALKALAKGTP